MTDEQVQILLERLQTYRNNLKVHLGQEAHYGGRHHAPIQVINDIYDARNNIAITKQKLLSIGITDNDHPDDFPDDHYTPTLTTAPALPLPQQTQRSATLVHLSTISGQDFESTPDHTLDWRPYFTGDKSKRDHQLTDPADWNTRLLPELYALEAKINKRPPLVRVYGRARLSAWVAFGYVFAEVANYTLEIEYKGDFWRTDAPKSSDFSLVSTNDNGSGRGQMLDGTGSTVAVGISVNRLIDQQVNDYFKDRSEPIAALLLLKTELEYLRNVGDAIALAELSKRHIGSFTDTWNAQRLLFFYAGPASAACIIGHRLNAVRGEIQLMEHMNPGYAPSFLLK
jgi:hypothetical protein